MSIVKEILHYDSGAIRSNDDDLVRLTELYEELSGHNDIKDLVSSIEHNKNDFITFIIEGENLQNKLGVRIMMSRVEKLLTDNSETYGDIDNWEKGIAIYRTIDSIFRHLILFLSGDTKEDHLAAIIFNALALDATEQKIRVGILDSDYDERHDVNAARVYYDLHDNT